MVAAPARPLQTVRFVAHTYRTLHALKHGATTPRLAGEALARAASNMGPLYTKLAQFISARRDALDPEFADALALVQDNAAVLLPPEPPSLQGYSVNPVPIARASIADVFEGTRLSDNTRVAIKQRRRGVKAQMTADLPLLGTVMRAAGAVGVPGAQNMCELIEQSSEMVLRELDFRVEAAATEEFKQLFEDTSWVVVPRVVAVGEDLLVTEFVPSHKAASVVAPNPALAQRLMTLYMRMLGKGFVHADPHPGNLGFRPGGTIVLYDFGAMLRVPGSAQEQVARTLHAGLTKDADGLVSALEELGVVTVQTGQRTAVRQLVRKALKGDVHQELKDAPEFASKNRRVVKFGTTFIYLTRTLSLIDGLCRTLDPQFRYDYSQWVEAPDGMQTAVAVLRDAASLPATLATMQGDLEDMQVRMIAEMEQMRRAAVSLGVLALVLGACRLAFFSGN